MGLQIYDVYWAVFADVVLLSRQCKIPKFNCLLARWIRNVKFANEQSVVS